MGRLELLEEPIPVDPRQSIQEIVSTQLNGLDPKVKVINIGEENHFGFGTDPVNLGKKVKAGLRGPVEVDQNDVRKGDGDRQTEILRENQ
jgi:hypothetical protein